MVPTTTSTSPPVSLSVSHDAQTKLDEPELSTEQLSDISLFLSSHQLMSTNHLNPNSEPSFDASDISFQPCRELSNVNVFTNNEPEPSNLGIKNILDLSPHSSTLLNANLIPCTYLPPSLNKPILSYNLSSKPSSSVKTKPLPKFFESLSKDDQDFFAPFASSVSHLPSFSSGLSTFKTFKPPPPQENILDESDTTLPDTGSDFKDPNNSEIELNINHVYGREDSLVYGGAINPDLSASSLVKLKEPTDSLNTNLQSNQGNILTTPAEHPCQSTPINNKLVSTANSSLPLLTLDSNPVIQETINHSSTPKRKILHPKDSFSSHPTTPQNNKRAKIVASPSTVKKRKPGLFAPFKSPFIVKKPATTFTSASNLSEIDPVVPSSTKVTPPEQVQLTITTHIHKQLLPELQSHENHLPERISQSELLRFGLDSSIFDIRLDNASRFRFKETFDRGNWGLFEAKADLINLVKDETWILNHFSHVIWKNACLVRNFPQTMIYRWNPDFILKELIHRHEKENIKGSSSIIKSIVEQTAPASWYFIAIVCHVASDTILVTDGWYSIQCVLDPPLLRALTSKRIFIGQKLAICGATLKSPGPMPVLESAEHVYLNITSNGTRRARWDAKLGIRLTPLFPIQIKNIHSDGANIPLIQASILRKYPIKFLGKSSNGNTIRTLAEEKARQIQGDSLEEEVTAFFSIRVTDDGVNEVIVTKWSTNLEEYADLAEGKRYQFLELAPSKSKSSHHNLEMELMFTRGSKWEILNDATENLATIRKITSIDSLETLPIKTEVDILATYIGEYLNGFTFLDRSFRFLVFSLASTKKPEIFSKLNPGTTCILENINVDIFYKKFGIQMGNLGFNSLVKMKPSPIQKALFDEQGTWFDQNLASAEKLLEDIIALTQQGVMPMAKHQLSEFDGQFINWSWEPDYKVRAQFKTSAGSILDLIIFPSQWKNAISQTLRGSRLDKLRANLSKGGFIHPSKQNLKETVAYLRIHAKLSTYNAYQLVDRILSKSHQALILEFPTKQHSVMSMVHEHEFRNLRSYISKQVLLYSFQIWTSPSNRYQEFPDHRSLEAVKISLSTQSIASSALATPVCTLTHTQI